MEPTSLIGFLLIGLIAGWLGSKLIRGGGFGLIGNLVVGVIGAYVGGYLFRHFGIAAGGILGSLVTATVGAAVFLFVVGLIKRV